MKSRCFLNWGYAPKASILSNPIKSHLPFLSCLSDFSPLVFVQAIHFSSEWRQIRGPNPSQFGSWPFVCFERWEKKLHQWAPFAGDQGVRLATDWGRATRSDRVWKNNEIELTESPCWWPAYQREKERRKISREGGMQRWGGVRTGQRSRENLN